MSAGAAGARVPRMSQAEAEVAAAGAGVPAYMATLAIFQVLLARPKVARAVNDLLGALLFDAALPHRHRELAIMRIGWATGSDYEWTQHWKIAKSFGVPEADLLGVRDWRRHNGFDDADRAVLAAVDEVLGGQAISAGTWVRLRAAFGADSAQLLEIVCSIGAWVMISGILRSLDVPLEDGVESWPPDGIAPPGAGAVGPDGIAPPGAGAVGPATGPGDGGAGAAAGD